MARRNPDRRAFSIIDVAPATAAVRRILILLVPTLLVGPVPAVARPVAIGIGEQQPSMFTNPLWQRLGIPHARYITAWDTLDRPRQRAELDAWMGAARAARARVTLSFQHSRPTGRARVPDSGEVPVSLLGLPPPLSRGPRLHRLERGEPPAFLSSRHPGRVAKLFDVAVRNCPGCRVIGGDVLDIAGMTAWVRAFMRRAQKRPLIWGLHNYVDVKHRRSTGTLALLAATRGRVWFTETGGWVLRRKYEEGKIAEEFRSSPRKAAGAAARVPPDMPEPSHPARVPLQLAGAEVRDDLGLRSHRSPRSAAPGVRRAAASRAAHGTPHVRCRGGAVLRGPGDIGRPRRSPNAQHHPA